LLRDKQAVLQELLVLRCARGERQALEELIQGWQDRLFYFLRRLVPTEEDAWDVLQQTWLRVLRGICTLKEPDTEPSRSDKLHAFCCILDRFLLIVSRDQIVLQPEAECPW
jgi:Sigma-70 region 2